MVLDPGTAGNTTFVSWRSHMIRLAATDKHADNNNINNSGIISKAFLIDVDGRLSYYRLNKYMIDNNNSNLFSGMESNIQPELNALYSVK